MGDFSEVIKYLQKAINMNPRILTKFHLILGVVLVTVIGSIWFYYGYIFSVGQIDRVLLISIDTCRSDYLSCYGYPRKTTPHIDALAEEGVLFENVITPVPITLPAHASMLTGTTPLYHGIHDNLGYRLGNSQTTLAEILRKRGYKTGAIISSFVLDSQSGLDQGFNTYNDHFENEIKSSNFVERLGEEASHFALEWLEKHKDDRFFLFLHYYDPHYRYEPPEPYATRFKNNLYAGEIAYTDYCIGQVIKSLKELELYDSTLIVITGDHGEMLGEHGEAEHGYFIYQSAIKVPLIFKLPGTREHIRIKRLVSLIDIFPTICSILKIESVPEAQGEDLSGHLFGEKFNCQERFLYCESITPTKHNANALLGIVTEGWKYIQTTRDELYDLIKDPCEKDNLIAEEPKKAYFLREHLRLALEERQLREDSDSRVELDEESIRRLKSLGYLAAGNTDDRLQVDRSKSDPKDLIKFHNIKAYNNMAINLIQEGKINEAVEAYEKIILHYEKAEIQHSMANIHINLAVALKKAGRVKDAEKQFETAAKLFRADLENNPRDASLWSILGNVSATREDFKSASDAFGRAVTLEPANPAHYNDLAMSLEYQERYDEAIEVLKKLIHLMRSNGEEETAVKLQSHIDSLVSKKSSQKK